MAKRPSQARDDRPPGFAAGGGRASGGKAGRNRRKEDDIKVECAFENMPVTPREIELLCHYLGAEIDKILRGDD